jgi:hypothetical protein
MLAQLLARSADNSIEAPKILSMETKEKNPTKQILIEVAILIAWFIAWYVFGNTLSDWLTN